MRTLSCLLLSVLVLAPLGEAQAMLITGPDARAVFEGFRDTPAIGDTFIDFESVPVGTNLGPTTSPFTGVGFASVLNTAGSPFTEHVEVSGAFNASAGNTIVGSPCGGCVDDGRVGYEITFDTPQQHVGLQRLWNNDTLTQFFVAGAPAPLAEHQGTGFVGLIAPGSDPGGWISRILINTVGAPGNRQVGYSDDLFFGTVIVSVPEPATLALLGLGLAGC